MFQYKLMKKSNNNIENINFFAPQTKRQFVTHVVGGYSPIPSWANPRTYLSSINNNNQLSLYNMGRKTGFFNSGTTQKRR